MLDQLQDSRCPLFSFVSDIFQIKEILHYQCVNRLLVAMLYSWNLNEAVQKNAQRAIDQNPEI